MAVPSSFRSPDAHNTQWGATCPTRCVGCSEVNTSRGPAGRTEVSGRRWEEPAGREKQAPGQPRLPVGPPAERLLHTAGSARKPGTKWKGSPGLETYSLRGNLRKAMGTSNGRVRPLTEALTSHLVGKLLGVQEGPHRASSTLGDTVHVETLRGPHGRDHSPSHVSLTPRCATLAP